MAPSARQPDTATRATATIVTQDLPASDDPLIGREQDLAEIQALIDDPNAPLVVLTGPGGIGKSRLAATVVSHEIARAARPAILIDLGHIPPDRTDLLMPTIAAALAVEVLGEPVDAAAIGAAIGGAPLLLALDGMEHLVVAGTHLTAMLRVAPRLTILVTSQIVLDVYGERVYPVAPISFPDLDALPATPPNLEEALTFDAVRLFVQRAFGTQTPPNLAPDDIAALLIVVARLEGHPLAIELAASHHRASNDRLPDLAEAMSHEGGTADSSGDFDRATPDMSPLQRTLARSYARLGPVEQSAFRRASILVGPWTVADAVPVLALGDEETTAASIALLLDASLIRALPSHDEMPHLQMLATLREFGTLLLEETGEQEPTAARHAASILAFAEEAEPELIGAAQNAWLDRISSRLPDVRRAFAWFGQVQSGPDVASLRLATALWRFGYSRGSLPETVGWLQDALAQSVPADQIPLRGRALNSLGLLVGMQGQRERARALHAEALAIGRTAGDHDLMGRACLGLGEQAVARKDLATAHNLIQQGSMHLARSKDLRGRAVALTNLANVLWSMGRLGEADALNREAHTLYERIGDWRGIAWSVTNRGRIALQRNAIGEAIPLLQDALRRYEETDDRVGIVETLDALARCALATGNAAAAFGIVQATDRTREDLHYPVPEIDRIGERAFRKHLTSQPAALQADGNATLEDAIALGYAVDAGALPTKAAAPLPMSILSPREMEVLVLLKQGQSNQEISDKLFIGVRTVQSHVLHIMRKLDASSRVAAVAIAMQRGMLPADA